MTWPWTRRRHEIADRQAEQLREAQQSLHASDDNLALAEHLRSTARRQAAHLRAVQQNVDPLSAMIRADWRRERE